MSWSCIQGDTLKPMPLQVLEDGAAFPLEEGDTVVLRYTDPTGATLEKTLDVVDAPTGQLEAVWEDGETDEVGTYLGQVKVTRVGDPQRFPDDGIPIVWNVYKAI